MLLTNDQRFLLDILREVRYMRLDQILPLMRTTSSSGRRVACGSLREVRPANDSRSKRTT